MWQPWASLVAMGVKRIEVRSWQTAYRGDLLIHASLRKPPRRMAAYYESATYFKNYIHNVNHLPYGAIIGQVRLTDIHSTDTLLMQPELFEGDRLRELAFDDFGPNRYGWMLDEARMFRYNLPMKGTLGLWDYDGLTE